MVSELRELEKAATPGPWKQIRVSGTWGVHTPLRTRDSSGEDNARFIAALRNAAPYLLDVVEAAQIVAWENRDVADPAEDGLNAAFAALDEHLGGKR